MKPAKKSFWVLFKNLLPLIILISIAAVLRLMWLDKIPIGVVGDELTYLLNAKAIALTGTDMTHTWNPLSIFIFQYPPGIVQAELPYFLFLPAVGLFPFSLLSAHITNAIIGIATVAVLYFLTTELFGEKIAIIAGLLAAINPWFIVINRTAYEVTPAVFFYLLGIYIVIKVKQWNIFSALPFFLLGFYSYIGMKPLFPFLVITASVYGWLQHGKKSKTPYILLCLTSFLVVCAYVVLLHMHPGASRLGELFVPSDPKIVSQVDALRRGVIHTPITSLFDNKISIFFTILVQKFFLIFSFDYLFLYGDYFFNLWHHGLFYYIDAVFLLVGGALVFVKQRREFFFLLVLVLLGTIPQLLHSADTNNFTPHIALIFPFLIMVIAVGIWSLIELMKSHKKKNVLTLLILIMYIVLLGNFVNIYFFQKPIEGGFYGFPDRVLVRYLQLASHQNQKISVYASEPAVLIQRYLFYTNTHIPPQQVQQVLSDKKLTIGNITIQSCGNLNEQQTSGTIIRAYACTNIHPNETHLSISQLSDGGEVYGIYHDAVCGKYVSRQYPSGLSLNDFAVESLPLSHFCNTFITTHQFD